MTKTVETLAGPLDTAKLGTTLMHEHLVAVTPEIQWSYPGFHDWDPEVVIPKLREAMRQVKQAGIDTLVEVTPLGLGRNIKVMQQVVEGTGLQVIAATGMYIYSTLPWLFRYGLGYNATEPGLDGVPDPLLDDLFLRDIQEGMEGTGVKAGIIKCATDTEGITPHVGRVLRSCARVHLQTGVPISTHTIPRRKDGLEQQQLFREQGVDLSRVLIGHCDDSSDLDYLEQLIDNGSWLGMDRFHPALTPTVEVRTDTVAELCRRGYADRLVLSHDQCGFLDWFPQEANFAQLPLPDRFLLISNVVVPALKERGVTQEQIDQMRIHNPRRFFEGN